jgi:hypothetical protein
VAGRTSVPPNTSPPTPAELARRRDAVADLVRQGYGVKAIAERLGIARSSVSNDLRALGIVTDRRHKRTDEPPPIIWRDRDLPSAPVVHEPTYLSSETAKLCRDFVALWRRERHASQLANDAREAIEAGDDEWIATTRGEVRAVVDYAQRLLDVLNDDEARDKAQRGLPEDRPRLRAIP